MAAVTVAEDRSLAVPPGKTVHTAYVAITAIELACRDRMAVGDVKEAYERQLNLGSQQRWPCPVGHWSDDRFVIEDGRHQFVASLMLGLEVHSRRVGRLMLGEHPVVAPMAVAFVLALFAVFATLNGEWVTSLLAYGDAVGMAAIAAHSRIERGSK